VRAFVVTGPRQGAVHEVEAPVPRVGEVVVDVHRVGVCGTDVEFWTGEMAYLHQGQAEYPLRLGHEWSGVVSTVGADVDKSWVGRRVTGDTMLGCGHCHRCLAGRQHVCVDRYEIGIRRGWPGALAEQLLVPASALHHLPDTVDDTAGAMVEPAGSALRAAMAAAPAPGRRVLIWGLGPIGLLATQFALAANAEVHAVGLTHDARTFATALGAHGAWAPGELPALAWDAIIDATNGADVPREALDLVEPGGRVVYIGLSGEPSTIDTRALVLKDVTAVGVLSGSPVVAGVIEEFASGRVDPRVLVGATVGLDRVADVLAGWRPDTAGNGPKIHVDPRLTS
jgi:2-desacetyl-2-hydroxyethyl bacteriochlorophyllide A dehydrogenase